MHRRDRRAALKLLSKGALWIVVAAGSDQLLGRALSRRFGRPRRRRPDDLAPIPWIGHC